eukprot:1152295-Pelagomonas_calceolata.AAC.5
MVAVGRGCRSSCPAASDSACWVGEAVKDAEARGVLLCWLWGGGDGAWGARILGDVAAEGAPMGAGGVACRWQEQQGGCPARVSGLGSRPALGCSPSERQVAVGSSAVSAGGGGGDQWGLPWRALLGDDSSAWLPPGKPNSTAPGSSG